MTMNEDKDKKGMTFVDIVKACFTPLTVILVIAVAVYILEVKNNSYRGESTYYVNFTPQVGTVVVSPEDLGDGIYLVQIRVDGKDPKRPQVFPALTAQPEKYPLGSKAWMKSIYTEGYNTATNDRFRIAVRPKTKE